MTIPKKKLPTKTADADKVLPGDVPVGVVVPGPIGFADESTPQQTRATTPPPGEEDSDPASPNSGGKFEGHLQSSEADSGAKAAKTLGLYDTMLSEVAPSTTASPERPQSGVEVTAGDSQPAGQHSAGEDSHTQLPPEPAPLLARLLPTGVDNALGEHPEADDLRNPTQVSTGAILAATRRDVDLPVATGEKADKLADNKQPRGKRPEPEGYTMSKRPRIPLNADEVQDDDAPVASRIRHRKPRPVSVAKASTPTKRGRVAAAREPDFIPGVRAQWPGMGDLGPLSKAMWHGDAGPEPADFPAKQKFLPLAPKTVLKFVDAGPSTLLLSGDEEECDEELANRYKFLNPIVVGFCWPKQVWEWDSACRKGGAMSSGMFVDPGADVTKIGLLVYTRKGPKANASFLHWDDWDDAWQAYMYVTFTATYAHSH